MIVVGLIFAFCAALLHVGIFVMESFAWTSTYVRTLFGTSQEEAAATKEMAFNQGFYNGFLAVAALVGIVLVALGQQAVGATLVITGTGSMLGAAAVLAVSSPDKRALGIKQGLFPALAILSLTIGLWL